MAAKSTLLRTALCVALLACSANALGQESSTPPPEKKTGQAKGRRKKRPLPTEPKDALRPAESTKIEPYLTYRLAPLVPRKESVYHKKEHSDFADQIYLTLRLVRTYDYRHEVVLEPSLRTFRNNPGSWEDPIVEQAYLESALSPQWSVTVGKKLEPEGSGFMVNPSDLLNENKDVFDALYQREGVVFSRLRFRTEGYALGLGFIPKRGQATKRGKGWLTAGGELLGTDLRLQVTVNESDKTTTGLSVQRFFADWIELHFEGRYQARQRSIAEQEHLAYSAYIGARPDTQSDDDGSAYYLSGTRLVFSPRRTLVLETITDQSGLLPADFARRFEDLRREAQERDKVREPPTRLFGRHYGFVSYQDQDSLAGTQLGGRVLVNLDDQSSFTTLSVRRSLSPITSVEVAPGFFKGGKDTEFGEMPFEQMVYLIFRGQF